MLGGPVEADTAAVVSASYTREPGRVFEGTPTAVVANEYERSPAARAASLQAHGTACAACGMDFGAVYGAAFAGFIHVHHIVPLSSIRQEYQVDPVADLRPVCPNCHAVIHQRDPPYSIEQVRAMLVAQSSQGTL